MLPAKKDTGKAIHTKIRAFMRTYHKGAAAALIIYDITKEDTFFKRKTNKIS